MIDHDAIRARSIEGMRFAPDVGSTAGSSYDRERYRAEQATRKLPVRFPTRSARPQAWRDDALCAGAPQEVFFPDKGGRGIYDAALAVCVLCPVTKECLEEALATERPGERREGVYGAMTPQEREREATRRTKR